MNKETVNHAVTGDIIGMTTGNYQIGYTLAGGKQTYSFQRFTTIYARNFYAKLLLKRHETEAFP